MDSSPGTAARRRRLNTRGSPDPCVAWSVANCWYCSKLNCIASVLMSSWLFDEEENQERTRRNDARRRQERNGETAYGEVRENSGTESRYCAKSRAAKHSRPWNCRKNHTVASCEPTGTRTDCCERSRPC